MSDFSIYSINTKIVFHKDGPVKVLAKEETIRHRGEKAVTRRNVAILHGRPG